MKTQLIKHAILIVVCVCAGILLAWYGFFTKNVMTVVLIIFLASAAVGAVLHLLKRGASHESNGEEVKKPPGLN